MDRDRLYAFFQIGGWGSFALIGLYMEHMAGAIEPNDIYTTIFQISIGLLGTHVLRTYLRSLHARDVSFLQLVIRSIAGILPVGAVITGLTLFHLWLVPLQNPLIEKITFLLLWVNWCLILTAWSSLYLVTHYFWRIQSMVVEKWKLQAALHQAQLTTLRAQLNPHFMFNMLNSLRALIDEDPEKAREVVTRLSRLLRTSLKDDSSTIDFEHEMAGVRDYLSLEGIRLEERLRWEIEAPPQANHLQVPRMLVLNLVENAVKHGIAHQPDGGEIKVTAVMSDDHWTISVRNTGQLVEPSNDGVGGLGLRNTRERLMLCYGPQASLSLAQEHEQQVCARVYLPLEARPITRKPLSNEALPLAIARNRPEAVNH